MERGDLPEVRIEHELQFAGRVGLTLKVLGPKELGVRARTAARREVAVWVWGHADVRRLQILPQHPVSNVGCSRDGQTSAASCALGQRPNMAVSTKQN